MRDKFCKIYMYPQYRAGPSHGNQEVNWETKTGQEILSHLNTMSLDQKRVFLDQFENIQLLKLIRNWKLQPDQVLTYLSNDRKNSIFFDLSRISYNTSNMKSQIETIFVPQLNLEITTRFRELAQKMNWLGSQTSDLPLNRFPSVNTNPKPPFNVMANFLTTIKILNSDPVEVEIMTDNEEYHDTYHDNFMSHMFAYYFKVLKFEFAEQEPPYSLHVEKHHKYDHYMDMVKDFLMRNENPPPYIFINPQKKEYWDSRMNDLNSKPTTIFYATLYEEYLMHIDTIKGRFAKHVFVFRYPMEDQQLKTVTMLFNESEEDGFDSDDSDDTVII